VTPDSSYVDFVVKKASSSPDLWRVPFLGGTPRKLATHVFSRLGWSPDGRRMAFVRSSVTSSGRETSVMIADADASNERVLAKRVPFKYFTGSPGWSPDGSAIAVTGGEDGRTDAVVMQDIAVLDAATGAERQTIAEPIDLDGLAWLDGNHLLAMRDTATTTNKQPMIVDLRSRRSTALTKDLATYSGVSLTADRLTAVSTRTDTRAGVWLGGASGEQMAPVVPESSAAPQQVSINNAGAMAYLAPSLDAATAIWTVRSGESPHIVVGRGWPSWPAIAPQSELIVFASDEPGGIYRISLDGTQLTKLTDMRGGPISVTPDGATVLFASGYHLWSVPVEGGTARDIFSRSGVRSRPAISPDGRRVAFFSGTKDRRFTIVCDLPDCTNVREQAFSFVPGQWTPDGRGLAYRHPDDPANIWIQPVDGGSPRPLTHFTDRRITSFGWSPDGRRLAASRATILSDLVLIKGFK
jgi:Tol biopolymer transport system component